MKNTYKTVIVGGGISGLSCARKLQEENEDFLLITENVGGRIVESQDGRINYGAYYVRSDYDHVLPYVDKVKRILLTDIVFYDLDLDKSYGVLNINILLHPFESIRFFLVLKKFFRRYKKLKIRSEKIGFKKALKEDAWLLSLYRMPAEEFIENNKFKYLSNKYLKKILYGTIFMPSSDATAFMLLSTSLPLFVPIYQFKFLRDKILKNFKDKIYLDSVVSMKKVSGGKFNIETKKGSFFSENLIVAMPMHITDKFFHVSTINKGVNAFMFHIEGVPKKAFQKKRGYLFGPKFSDVGLFRELDNSYLLYSVVSSPKFENFFDSYRIINKKAWEPAFYTKGSHLIDVRQDDNFFIIGDHNLCGLEDSAISGVYAANEILKKS